MTFIRTIAALAFCVVLAACETVNSNKSGAVELGRYSLTNVVVRYPLSQNDYTVQQLAREVYNTTDETGFRRVFAATSPEGLAQQRTAISSHITPHVTRQLNELMVGSRGVTAEFRIVKLYVGNALTIITNEEEYLTAAMSLIDDATGITVYEAGPLTVSKGEGNGITLGGGRQRGPQSGVSKTLSDLADEAAGQLIERIVIQAGDPRDQTGAFFSQL